MNPLMDVPIAALVHVASTAPTEVILAVPVVAYGVGSIVLCVAVSDRPAGAPAVVRHGVAVVTRRARGARSRPARHRAR